MPHLCMPGWYKLAGPGPIHEQHKASCKRAEQSKPLALARWHAASPDRTRYDKRLLGLTHSRSCSGGAAMEPKGMDLECFWVEGAWRFFNVPGSAEFSLAVEKMPLHVLCESSVICGSYSHQSQFAWRTQLMSAESKPTLDQLKLLDDCSPNRRKETKATACTCDLSVACCFNS